MDNIYNPCIKGVLCSVTEEIQTQTFIIYNINEAISEILMFSITEWSSWSERKIRPSEHCWVAGSAKYKSKEKT